MEVLLDESFCPWILNFLSSLTLFSKERFVNSYPELIFGNFHIARCFQKDSKMYSSIFSCPQFWLAIIPIHSLSKLVVISVLLLHLHFIGFLDLILNLPTLQFSSVTYDVSKIADQTILAVLIW